MRHVFQIQFSLKKYINDLKEIIYFYKSLINLEG